MARTRRKKAQREADLLEISRMYVRGVTQLEIAAALEVSQQQISYDFQELQRRWAKASMVIISEAKGKELAKLDALEREYWEAWARSREHKESRTTEMSNETEAQLEMFPPEKVIILPGTKVTIRQEGQCGDPRYLEGILRCVAKRAEILGLDAPKKFSGPDGKPVEFILKLADDEPKPSDGQNPGGVPGEPYTLALSPQ